MKQLVENRSAVVLDARAPEKYRAGHIPGALSLPVGGFEEGFPRFSGEIKKSAIIVVYCLGVTCHDSALLAQRLAEKGIGNILIYPGGMDDWSEKQYEIEK